MKEYAALSDVTPVSIGVDTPIEHRFVDLGEVTLHVALAGPEDGKPLFLLHGFPEAWFGWRAQIDPLVSAGYRLIIPDQRGYNLSARPAGIKSYRIDRLSGDISNLAASLGISRYGVAGHDWGAAVTWNIAHEAPEGLAAVGILNVPEPRVMRSHLRTFTQLKKSWYMFAFQTPFVPEVLLKSKRVNMLRNSLADSSRPGTFSDEELVWYQAAWDRPGAVSAMLGWYRASIQHPRLPASDAVVEVPVRIIWGEQDPFLGKEMVEPSAERCRDATVVRIPEATHWVQHEEPERVNAALIEHFNAHL